MLTILGFLVFGAALAIAGAAIALTIVPASARIVDALYGRSPPPSAFQRLVHAERRIAVRRWVESSRPAAGQMARMVRPAPAPRALA